MFQNKQAGGKGENNMLLAYARSWLRFYPWHYILFLSPTRNEALLREQGLNHEQDVKKEEKEKGREGKKKET